MSRSYKTSDQGLLKKLKDSREGQRAIGLAAVTRSGAGAHINKRNKRTRNPNNANNWRKEWE